MSTKTIKITAKAVANLETEVPNALQAIDVAESNADQVRSDAYALFATAVLSETGNEPGDRKGGAVRKLIATTATSAGYKFTRGSLSKAEHALAVLVTQTFGERENYTVAEYAEVYATLRSQGLTLWAVYEQARNAEQDNGDDETEGDAEGDDSGKEFDGHKAFSRTIARLVAEGKSQAEIVNIFHTALEGQV
jgi:hypothetical protein